MKKSNNVKNRVTLAAFVVSSVIVSGCNWSPKAALGGEARDIQDANDYLSTCALGTSVLKTDWGYGSSQCTLSRDSLGTVDVQADGVFKVRARIRSNGSFVTFTKLVYESGRVVLERRNGYESSTTERLEVECAPGGAATPDGKFQEFTCTPKGLRRVGPDNRTSEDIAMGVATVTMRVPGCPSGEVSYSRKSSLSDSTGYSCTLSDREKVKALSLGDAEFPSLWMEPAVQ